MSFYDDRKTGAMAKARQAWADSERGVTVPRVSLTVEMHLRDWLENRVQHRVQARTYESHRQHCENHIIPSLGKVRLVQLTPGHVQRMLAQVLRSGLSETSVKHIRSTLSGALRPAQFDHGLPRNVASLAKLPKSDRPSFEPEVITHEDARAILGAFQGSRIEAPVLFAAATGIRQGELLALRWDDIDRARGSVRIRHAVDIQDGARVLARPKSERAQRTLQLPQMAVSALDLAREIQDEWSSPRSS